MTKKLSNDDIRDLVTKAFVIEAITDKPGCTSRYHDIQGKPLQDFIHAGINVNRYFSFKKAGDDIFSNFPDALKHSNKHKSSKYINFGLLEIMFLAVAARSQCDSPQKIMAQLIKTVKHKSESDVQSLLNARQIGFATSSKDCKLKFKLEDYKNISSPYDFYMKWMDQFGKDTSHYQWAFQYKLGLPILKHFFESYRKEDEYMKTTKEVFERTSKDYPKVAIGIHADMCAAALFLYFSYTNEQNS